MKPRDQRPAVRCAISTRESSEEDLNNYFSAA
jgi:hypothetical protein